MIHTPCKLTVDVGIHPFSHLLGVYSLAFIDTTSLTLLFVSVSFDQARHAGSERRTEGGEKQTSSTAGQ